MSHGYSKDFCLVQNPAFQFFLPKEGGVPWEPMMVAGRPGTRILSSSVTTCQPQGMESESGGI